MININPELKIGDRVVCVVMEDETSVMYGTKGTVKGKSVVFGIDQYSVDWDNGSTLQLLADADKWMLEDDFLKLKKNKKNITEGNDKNIIKNSYLFKTVKLVLLDRFLVTLRKSGIVNMIQSAPYLYMGRERIEHELKYSNKDNEYIDDVLDMADEVQAEMINSSIKYLEKQGKEPDLSSINRTLRKLSTDIVNMYINLR
jgi:hypothetical protein